MTIALADLFRYSINYRDNNYSSVKDELEMAEVYLQIEKIRFEDQLSYQYRQMKMQLTILYQDFYCNPSLKRSETWPEGNR